jgi:hypothetical protein
MRSRIAAALGGLLALWAVATGAGGPPAAPDPAARLPRGDDAWEHWDLAAHFESGHRLYARFLITNQGPGDRTAVAFGHLLRPDGEALVFSNGRREGRWQLTDGGRRLDIGSSLLAFGSQRRRFEVDNDKRGIKLHFEVSADAPGLAAPPAPGGARLQLLNLASPAQGRLWLTGMAEPRALRGHALITHSWGARGEAESAALRTDFASLGPGHALFVSDWRAGDGTRWSWAASASPGGGLRPHADVRVEERSTEKGATAYPLPERVEVRGKAIESSIALEAPPVLVSDPLDALPSLLRMVYSFGGRPRHIWADAAASVALGPRDDDPVGPLELERFESAGIAAFFFSDATP